MIARPARQWWPWCRENGLRYSPPNVTANQFVGLGYANEFLNAWQLIKSARLDDAFVSVMPMAVRSLRAWHAHDTPADSIFWQTARTCPSVACAFMTTNMAHLGNHQCTLSLGWR